MNLRRFMMMHGLGSPGYIARRMCKHYVAIKQSNPDLSEEETLRRVYVTRIAAQTMLGGPKVYLDLKSHPDRIDAIVGLNSDLLALIRLAVFQEHSILSSGDGVDGHLQALDEVILEVIRREVPSWRNPDIGPTVVDGSSFEYGTIPMTWTGWHNGSHHNPFTGYGFKIDGWERDMYFDRSWKRVTIALPATRGYVLTEANIDKGSFWKDCRELISQDIGIWMMDNKYAPWKRGFPPRFIAHPVGAAVFEVQPFKSEEG